MYTNYFAMGIKAMFVLDFPRKEQGITDSLCSFTVLGKSWGFFRLFQITLLRENVPCAPSHGGKGILEPLTAQATVAEGHVAGAGNGGWLQGIIFYCNFIIRSQLS